MTQDIHVTLNPELPWLKQQEEKSFHHQIGLKFEEESSKVPHLEYRIVRC
jgi:hypothetical protein